MILTGNDMHQLNYQDFIRNVLALMIKAGRVIPPQMMQVLQGKPLEVAEAEPVIAYINHGRWVADCPFCPGAELIFQDTVAFLCLSCFNQEANFKSLPIAFPLNVDRIEAVLEERPIIAGRNWKPPKTLNTLIEENKLGVEGWHRSWTSPRTWTTAEIVTAGMLNEQVRDNEIYLKAEADKLDDISYDVSPTRAVDTIYQNSTKLRLVVITVECDAGETATLEIGSASPPTDIAAAFANHAGNADHIYGVVVALLPPSYYYRLVTTVSTPVITYWAEYDLH